MEASGKMALLLQSLVKILQHPVVQTVQVQASLVLLIGIIGWTIAGYRKGREAQRLSAAGYAAVLQQIQDAAQLAGLATTAGAVDYPQSSPKLQSPSSSIDGSAWIDESRQPAIASKPSMPTTVKLGPSGLTTVDHPQQHSPILEYWIQQTRQHANVSAAQRLQQQVQYATSSGLIQRQNAARQHAQLQEQQSRTGPAAQAAADTASLGSASSIFKSQLGSQTACLCVGWPPLAIVCPVKGCRQHSRDNWATQLAAHYGGPRVFVFVVESEHDLAAAALRDMMQQYPNCSRQQEKMDLRKLHCNSAHQHQHRQRQQHQVIDCWQDGPQHQVLLVTAGLASSCSQKIHNILAGIDVALQQQQHWGAVGSSGGYVCLLDDDVALHPLSLMQMVDALEADQSLFMVTGYPYDIVAAPTSNSSSSFWGRLCSHAAAAYHLPLCIGFMVADRGGFVWGGAMMFRTEYLATAAAESAAEGQATAENRDNILRVWRDGGYSDDLLVSGFCAARNLSIGLPVSATLPQMLPATCTFKQYWNYLRRQLFVLDTYYSPHNKQINHTMMILHSYGSALFTGATVATALQLLLLIMTVTMHTFSIRDGSTSSSSSSNQRSWLSVNLQRPLHFHDSLLGFTMGPTTTATWLFAATTVGSWVSIWYLHSQVRNLFRVLSPCASREVSECRVSVLMLWLGWILENLILPLCALHCYLCDRIVWGGITYYKKDGRIARIVHPSA